MYICIYKTAYKWFTVQGKPALEQPAYKAGPQLVSGDMDKKRFLLVSKTLHTNIYIYYAECFSFLLGCLEMFCVMTMDTESLRN